MSIQLTVHYKNGNELSQIVNYVHFEEDAIIFTVKNQITYSFGEQVRIHLANIESFDIEPSDKKFN